VVVGWSGRLARWAGRRLCGGGAGAGTRSGGVGRTAAHRGSLNHNMTNHAGRTGIGLEALMSVPFVAHGSYDNFHRFTIRPTEVTTIFVGQLSPMKVRELPSATLQADRS
jgi:hypothetical protein